ncbi:unnamed protein product, partial [Brugia timori]|uniref:Reverse transcriptase domain-containing protein n=1 Tax=Brugia timori TaxID=42155 RepID=A0A0R3RB04_9BILA
MWCFIDETIHLSHLTNLVNTSFGWMLAGTHYADWLDDNFLPSFFVSPQSVENLWRLEILGIEPINSAVVRDEIHALEIFFKNISVVDQRYQIRWLYRWDKPNLADNFNVAFKRLQGQMKKLAEQIDFYDRYNQYFLNLLDLGMIEECTLEASGDLLHYLPHKGILDMLKSTPFRAVFDASSHAKGKMSLNDIMYKGTNFLANILTIFFNFQQKDVAVVADIKKAFHQISLHPSDRDDVAVVADIKKAFHQISLHPSDRDVTRFLWIKNPNQPLTRENLIVFRFTRVPFGIVTSPFILAATLLYHFQKTDYQFYEKFAKHFYVDNLVTSVTSSEEALALYERANKIFQEVSMQLAQWGSNEPSVRQHFDENHRLEKDDTTVLGLDWNMSKDFLAIHKKKPKGEISTKRKFLQYMSSIYDPVGWFAPSLVSARGFLKYLWELDLTWDENFSADLKETAE